MNTQHSLLAIYFGTVYGGGEEFNMKAFGLNTASYSLEKGHIMLARY